MTGGLLWDLLFLVSISVFVMGSLMRGHISVGLAAFVLIGFVLFRAGTRALGGGMGRAIRWSFSVGLPLASLGMFAAAHGRGNAGETAAILAGMATLVIVLFGLYLMLRGPFARRR